jgi:transcriptional regulator with XRE-family HTH domain
MNAAQQITQLDWSCHIATMTDFHQRLRTLRSPRKITQSRLAELLGISPRVYTRWKNGDATPLFGTVVKIADILNVTLDELAGRQEGAGAEPRSKNPELHRLYQKVDSLTDEEQKALLVVLDSFVKRSRMDSRLAE